MNSSDLSPSTISCLQRGIPYPGKFTGPEKSWKPVGTLMRLNLCMYLPVQFCVVAPGSLHTNFILVWADLRPG